MDKYTVKGMKCAACSQSVERAVAKLNKVTAVNVNLLLQTMTVEGDVKREAVIKAVKRAGFEAIYESGDGSTDISPDGNGLKGPFARLILSIGLLVILMYITMGHNMAGFPLPPFMNEHCELYVLFQLLFALAIMIVNYRFFVSGVKAVLHGSPNMDTLVSLGSFSAFAYSCVRVFQVFLALSNGNNGMVEQYVKDLYFDSAGTILTLISLGKLLEERAKGKTTDAIRALTAMTPKKAHVIREGEEIEVPVGELNVGDTIIVRTGDQIPTDAVVIEGSAAIDESTLTGESVPVTRTVGDEVFGACINSSGVIRCEVTKVGEDTTFAGIVRMVGEAASGKAPIAKLADRISGIFVPAVILVAVIAFVVWMAISSSVSVSLERAIAVLVVSCPCSLGLATPVAIMVGNGVGAKCGILFKTAEALENTGRIGKVVLDKTGTITKGAPFVTDIKAFDYDDNELIALLRSLEMNSTHPISKAVVLYADSIGVSAAQSPEKFSEEAGGGLTGDFARSAGVIYAGSEPYVSGKVSVQADAKSCGEAFQKGGKTVVYVGSEKLNRIIGVIGVADVIKEDSADAIRKIKELGIKVTMLTGDNERTAAVIAKESGIEEVIAGVRPNDKQEVVAGMMEDRGKLVAMIGDGINDAPALTQADIGMAIGVGTFVAIDAADVVITKGSLYEAYDALRLGRNTLKIIHENLFWAFIYNVVGILLAAGVIPKISLSPMLCALFMSLSSFMVVSNALRLNTFKKTTV